MASENAIERILNRLNESDDGVSVKTAAAPAPNAETRLLDTVRRVSESVSVKTASAAPVAASPASELGRMAKEAADAEEASLNRKASSMGAAFADGFMERYAQYDTALSSQGVKTASVDPELIKQAAEDGYKRAVADMEKKAEAEYKRGYEEQLQAIHKTAAEIHYGGQQMAHQVIERIKTANAQTK